MSRILIVDDEEAICEVLRLAFETTGTEAAVAVTGEDALRQMERERFDLLLVDKNLPGMSGVDLIRQVRAADARLPVIMMTAYATAESVRSTLNMGITAYLEKPFNDLIGVTILVEKTLQEERERAAALSQAQAAAARRPGEPEVTVVIASSDPDLRTRASAPVDTRYARVAFAESGEEVGRALARDRPGLVVLDAQIGGDVAALAEEVGRFLPRPISVVVSAAELSVPVLKKLVDLSVAGVFDKRFDETYSKGVNALIQRLRRF